jgi:hypothetical protein
LLGILVGLVQWGVLRVRNKIAAHWIIATVAGYALGLPLGFSIPLAFAWGTTKMMKIQLIGEGGNAFINFPLLSGMFLSGAIIAILQWISAKATFQNRVQSAALWVLGSALAWASAFFLTSSAWAAGMPSTAQSAVAGATVGMITGLLLILLMSSSIRSTRRKIKLVH